MRATIRPERIDILGASGLPSSKWDTLLDDLKAEQVPGLTPTGKRVSAVVGPSGRIDAFIYRTATMLDAEIIRILAAYGIEATVTDDQK